MEVQRGEIVTAFSVGARRNRPCWRREYAVCLSSRNDVIGNIGSSSRLCASSTTVEAAADHRWWNAGGTRRGACSSDHMGTARERAAVHPHL